MPGAETSIIIAVPPKKIYDVVADFDSYPDFQPEVKKVETHKKGKQVSATFELSVIKKIRYTLNFHFTPNKKIAWNFVEGDLFKDNQGHWLFEEEGKNKTKATYHVEVSFGFMVPSMITNKLIGHNLPAMLEKFKQRAESL